MAEKEYYNQQTKDQVHGTVAMSYQIEVRSILGRTELLDSSCILSTNWQMSREEKLFHNSF
jgi:hypothetical protein